MAKIEFEMGIDSVRGILMGTDPYYIRRYPGRDGVMHIVQGRPNRSGHIPSEAEKKARDDFIAKYGKLKHEQYVDRIYKNQLTIQFAENE